MQAHMQYESVRGLQRLQNLPLSAACRVPEQFRDAQGRWNLGAPECFLVLFDAWTSDYQEAFYGRSHHSADVVARLQERFYYDWGPFIRSWQLGLDNLADAAVVVDAYLHNCVC